MSEPIDTTDMRRAARAVWYLATDAPVADALSRMLTGAAIELDQLRQWKSEAITVLNGWDDVFEALGMPGKLGESKSAAAKAEIDRLRGELASWDRHVCTTTDDRWDLR